MKIGFIGAGNMAGAIIRGLAADGYPGSDLVVYDPDAAKLMELFEDCGIRMGSSGAEVVEEADTVVLGIKPQVFPSALPALQPSFLRRRPLVISIAAGKTLATLEAAISSELPIVRVMPNINAKVGEAITAYCGNARVTEEHLDTVRMIFEAVGETVALEERLFSAHVALGGAAPAFTYLFIDALAAAAVREGIPKATALKIARQTVLGSALLLKESGEHPRILMDQVCSPGGVTIEGVIALAEGGFEAAVAGAVKAACERDKNLG